MLCASFAECDRVIAVMFFILAVGAMGPFISGVKVNSADLSPNHVSILMSFTSFLALPAAFAAPSVTSLLTPNVSKNIY